MPFETQPQAWKPIEPHWSPDPHEPKQPPSCPKYWQASVVGVVLVVVVTVHAPEAQASQQLAKIPAQALPPFGATHSAVSRLREHEVLPLLAVRQQVTPDHLLGRVTAAFWTINSAPGPIGAALFTALAATIGAPLVLLLIGAGFTAIALLGLRTPARTRYPEAIATPDRSALI